MRTKHEERLSRVDTKADPIDSPTAGQNEVTPAPAHTPGPWSLVGVLDSGHAEIAAPCYEHPNCGKTIVFISSGSSARPFQCSQGKHRNANALLISAAPDMLAMLKRFVVLGDASVSKAIRSALRRDEVLAFDELIADGKLAIAVAEGRYV